MEEPAATPSAGEGVTAVVAEDPATIPVAEEAAAAEVAATAEDTEVATTTGAVVDTREEATEASREIPEVGGSESADHSAGKEVVEDVPSSPLGGVPVTESKEEEYFNFCSDFFDPDSIVESSAYRSRDRVPHPSSIPNCGDIFDNERLKGVWWKRVEEIDGLKDPTRITSMFAWSNMNVSIHRYSLMVFTSFSYRFSPL